MSNKLMQECETLCLSSLVTVSLNKRHDVIIFNSNNAHYLYKLDKISGFKYNKEFGVLEVVCEGIVQVINPYLKHKESAPIDEENYLNFLNFVYYKNEPGARLL